MELARSQRFVETLEVIWPTDADCELAYRLILKHRLSSGLGLGDFIIAAQCINKNAKLLTFNLKHFKAVTGLTVEQPYAR